MRQEGFTLGRIRSMLSDPVSTIDDNQKRASDLFELSSASVSKK